MNKDRIIDYCDRIIEFALYALIFCLPFSKALVEISASLIIPAWITKKIFQRKLLGTYLNIPIIAYILAAFLSAIFSSNLALSLKNFLTKTMEYIFLFFIVAEFAGDKRKLKNTVIVMMASAAMIGLDAIFQHFFGFDFLRLRRLQTGRITASFAMPADLAGYLTPLLCLFLSLSFLPLNLKKGLKLFLRVGSIVLLSLIFVSLVRGAWIGLIVAICFLGLLENRKVIYLAFAFLFIFCLLMPQFLETASNILGRLKTIFVLSDTSSLDRKVIWQVAVRMIRDRPLFGQGLTTFMGNFARYGQDYHYFKTQGLVPYAHNCYLQMAAETGIVGLVSFLMLVGTFFIYTINSLMKLKDKFSHAVLSGVSAGIIVTLVHSAVDTNLYSLQLSILFWIMLGLNAALQPGTIPGQT